MYGSKTVRPALYFISKVVLRNVSQIFGRCIDHSDSEFIVSYTSVLF